MSSGFSVNCRATEAELLNYMFSIIFFSRSIPVSTVSSPSTFFGLSILLSYSGFLSDLFYQFLIRLILNHLLFFLLSDLSPKIIPQHQSMFLHHFYLSYLFQQIPCHHSYPPDFFYRILSQHCLHIYVNSTLPL